MARVKFARYRKWFALTLAAFGLTWALEMLFFGARVQIEEPVAAFRQTFAGLATREGVLYLVTLLTGVTIYAPAVSLIASVLRGFAAGFVLSSLLPLTGGKAVFGFLFTALYLLLSALWYLAYADFCACVSLRVFASHAQVRAGGEEQLFGGSLFYAEFFCGAVNLRFLFSYILFFFASLTGQMLLTAGYALARTRLF